jgi:GTP-binding protein HflX
VGFIRDLPHGLVDAFKATLQEAADADLLLHVVDCSNPSMIEQIAEVEHVLEEIGAVQQPVIVVFNKIDAAPNASLPPATMGRWNLGQREVDCIYLSAQTGQGVAELRVLLASYAGTALGNSHLYIRESSDTTWE